MLGVSTGTGLPTRELVSVVSAVLAREAGSVMVAVGLHMLKIVLIPKGVVIGSVGMKGGGPTEAEGFAATEANDEDIKPPLAGDDIKPPLIGAAIAAALVGPMIPVVGHTMIWPSDVPGNGLNTPR
jgi:hypothetical protein